MSFVDHQSPHHHMLHYPPALHVGMSIITCGDELLSFAM